MAQLGTTSMLADLMTRNFFPDEHCKLCDLCMGYGQKPDLPDDLRDELNSNARTPVPTSSMLVGPVCRCCGAPVKGLL